MKFGLLIPFWFILFPLFSQDCEEVPAGSVRFYTDNSPSASEIRSYFVPCSETQELFFTIPLDFNYTDPDPATEAGIILVLLIDNPEKSALTIDEFNALIYRDLFGNPVYFSNPGSAIQVSKLLKTGNFTNEFVLMPVLISNLTGSDTDEWFEEDCVRLYPGQSLTIVEFPTKGYTFPHFNEITFNRWPADTSILDFFDFTFTDQKSGNPIPFSLKDNQTLRLQFPQSHGIFNYKVSRKSIECKAVEAIEFGINWSYPVVEVLVDSVDGFRAIDKCIPVRIRNFAAITGFYIMVSWHKDSLSYSGVQNIHPALLPYLEFNLLNSNGPLETLSINLPANLDTLTLPDSTVLFEWCGKPLSNSGNRVSLAVDSDMANTGFKIYGFETGYLARKGGIFIQEDREINYKLVQLCVPKDEMRQVRLVIENDEAYPYTYSFHSPAIKDSILFSTPFLIPDVPPGNYQFTIRDSFGFEITESIVMEEEISPRIELQINETDVLHPDCLNPMGGQIGVAILPEDVEYHLELSNSTASFNGNLVSGLEAGTYIVRAKDDAGCVDSISYTLKPPQEIKVKWDSDRLVLCPGEKEIWLAIEENILDTGSSIEFQVDGGPVHRLGDSIKLVKAGDYVLNFWNEDECTLDTIVQLRAGPDELQIWDTTSIEIYAGDTLLFHSPSTDGLENISWKYGNQTVGEDEILLLIPRVSNTLDFSASVFGKCYYTDSLNVHVILPNKSFPEFEFPNAFTPNGDGVNDYYRIVPSKDIHQIIKMEVFDRYGNYVYKSDYSDDVNNQSTGWNGRHAGVDAPPGIYAVQVEIQLRDGREKQIGFDLLLIR